MGRSSIDLYANDVGAPFVDIKSFAAYVGGSPTNIAVGAQRLGLKAAVLTAVGDDPGHLRQPEPIPARSDPDRTRRRFAAQVG